MLRRAKAYTARNKRSASTSDLYTEKCLNNKKRALQEQERDQKALAGQYRVQKASKTRGYGRAR